MENVDSGRATRILVAVDASNFGYQCVFAAERRWASLYPDDAGCVLKPASETDQSDLPDLVNLDSFRKTLSFVAQDRLGSIMETVSQNHPDEVELATGMDVVFAMDSYVGDSFRRRLYPAYKANRRKVKSTFDVRSAKRYLEDVVFQELGIETLKGYKVVKVDGCECDDIVYVLMNRFGGYMSRFLFSSDRDFQQIPDVVQYTCWGKRVTRDVDGEELSPGDFLLWKVVRGDPSDNIANVFPKVGEKKSLALVKDRRRLKEMLVESEDAAERFRTNLQLIDLRRIPSDMEARIYEVLGRRLSEPDAVSEFGIDECMVI